MWKDIFKQNSRADLARFVLPQILMYLIVISIAAAVWVYGQRWELVLPIIAFLVSGFISYSNVAFRFKNQAVFFVGMHVLTIFVGSFFIHDLLFLKAILGISALMLLRFGERQLGGYFYTTQISEKEISAAKLEGALRSLTRISVYSNGVYNGFSSKEKMGSLQIRVEKQDSSYVIKTFPQQFSSWNLTLFNHAIWGDDGRKLANKLIEASKY